MSTNTAVSFIHEVSPNDFVGEPHDHLQARVLDTLAATTAGFRLSIANVVRDYAIRHHAGETATLLDGQGECLSEQGSTLVNATAANALDVDDGHRDVKGHPASVVIPPALAVAEATNATIGEFLVAVGVGYELAVRAGLAIHATDNVYTGTESWGAVGTAAAVARLRELDQETTAAALGTAEYHAPRTPIMRGVKQPGMTNDGIGWGAYAGLAAVDLAEAGFTASGTVFDATDVTATNDLYNQFYLTTGYFKPYPCCRWAQSGVDAVLHMRNAHGIDPLSIETLRIHTFEAATQLHTRHPDTAEAAEYSYPYPVAAALANGKFTPTELSVTWRKNSTVQTLANRIELVVDPEIEERFPTECLAWIELVTDDGQSFSSDVTRARGARERPLLAAERRAKAVDLIKPSLPSVVVEQIENSLETPSDPIATLLDPWQETNRYKGI
jgi:2-methylcitrate dehydratase PrpD